jgi:hypothetical protein
MEIRTRAQHSITTDECSDVTVWMSEIKVRESHRHELRSSQILNERLTISSFSKF